MKLTSWIPLLIARNERPMTITVSGTILAVAFGIGQRLRRGARLWTVAVSAFKAETYRFLRLERPADDEVAFPDGTVHLPRWADGEWLKQLVAEQLVTIRNKRGFSRQEWQKMRERNEALDCRVYARAAAWIAGADRWSEATGATSSSSAAPARWIRLRRCPAAATALRNRPRHRPAWSVGAARAAGG